MNYYLTIYKISLQGFCLLTWKDITGMTMYGNSKFGENGKTQKEYCNEIGKDRLMGSNCIQCQQEMEYNIIYVHKNINVL